MQLFHSFFVSMYALSLIMMMIIIRRVAMISHGGTEAARVHFFFTSDF